MLPIPIQEKLLSKKGIQVLQSQSLGGGCIHNAQKVQTDKGIFFLKWNEDSAFSNFEREAKGLQLLASKSQFLIPSVHHLDKAQGYAFLLLDFIESKAPALAYWEDFGEKLADLHLHTNEAFGLDHDNFIGALEQSNAFRSSWAEFFIECRIQPKLKQAVDKGNIVPSLIATFDKLFTRLENWFPQEAPALLHGDLWGGNILVNREGFASIFDPAVYYGHREMELAFMTMFDRQPQSFYEAYQAQRPLESGWEQRLDLYNLYPLLVHVILFGNSYLGSVKRILDRFV
ncbi:MAG: fructosamine kinase family protein [Bacteroidota bacterium]